MSVFNPLGHIAENMKGGYKAAPATRVRIDEQEVISRTKRRAAAAGIEVNGEMGAITLAVFATVENIYITGGAGTGKTTYLTKVLIPELEHRGLNYHITASTGIAGTHVDGKTLHSFLGIGLGPEWPPGAPILNMSADEIDAIYDATYKRWQNNPRIPAAMRDGLTRKLIGAEVILLEEVSMISGWGLLGYVDYFLKKVRNKPDKPFGGIQMIFVGDFGQLPPVEKWPGVRPDWAFKCAAWTAASVRPMKFSKIHRQKAGWFTDFLNETRDGVPVSPMNLAHLRHHLIPGATPTTHPNFTFLCATNKEADIDNNQALDQYPGPTVEAKAFFDVREEQLKYRETIDEVQRRLIDGKAAIRDVLRLRVGLPVLLTVNSPTEGYVNGTKGFVHKFIMDKADPTKVAIVEVRVPNPQWTQRHRASFTPEELARVETYDTIHAISIRYWSRSTAEDPEELEPIDPKKFAEEMAAGRVPVQRHRWPVVGQFPMIPASAITIHKCVAHDTLLPTMAGIMEIGEMCKMESMPAVSGVAEFKSACEPYLGSEELGYRVTTRRGFSVVCSERHPLMVINVDGECWTKAPLLKVGDKLRMRSGTFASGDGRIDEGFSKRPAYHLTAKDRSIPTEMSLELAWLLGALIGDGCVTDKRDGRTDITSMDAEVTTRFSKYMETLFGLTTTTTESDGEASVTYTHSKGVRDFLVHLGVPYNRAPAKRIPRAIFRGSVAQQAMFLQGLFDTDGGVNTAVHFTTSSLLLARETHAMLLNLGIVGTLGQMTESAWRINITGNDVVVFRDIVGFYIPRKDDACQTLARQSECRGVVKTNLGFYPDALGKRIASAIRSELLALQAQKVGSRGRTMVGNLRLNLGPNSRWGHFLGRVVNGDSRLADVHLVKMGEAMPGFEAWGPVSRQYIGEALAGNFLDEIVSITRETALMRDICVPEGHAFVGNGFLNHNSQGMSLDDVVVRADRAFAPGQVYVALSRLRSPDGLVITSLDLPIFADPTASEFNRAVQSYSVDMGEPVEVAPAKAEQPLLPPAAARAIICGTDWGSGESKSVTGIYDRDNGKVTIVRPGDFPGIRGKTVDSVIVDDAGTFDQERAASDAAIDSWTEETDQAF